MATNRIKAIDKTSVHRITSSQVVVDLQTAIKELVENALDANATAIDVRIKENGLKSIEVVDNGNGISPEDYDTVALKHHTSKLSSFEDLTTVETFGFRGEALASLCALCENVTITTATETEAPMGTVLEFDRMGKMINNDGKIARQRGTTVTLTGLFAPLPVRRKEFERHAKREYGKALGLLSAYALIPCASDGSGVKFTVSHLSETGKKTVQIQANGSEGLKKSVVALWGSKALDNVVPLNLDLDVEPDSASLRKRGLQERNIKITLTGLISSFAVGCGRSSNDRQFLFVNKRPCNLVKVQKAINEVYKSFNATQSPFIVVDFSIPTDACDINVSPDKRTIFLHSEQNLIEALKAALTEHFDQTRSTFTLNPSSKQTSNDRLSKRTSTRNSNSEQSSSSPMIDSLLPSSDPLPNTQQNPFGVTSSSSDPVMETTGEEALDNELPEDEPHEVGAHPLVDKATSRLEDHMSPSPPPQEPKEARIDDNLPPISPAQEQRSSKSPGLTSSARPKKQVQMILDTSGAAWSLSKTKSAAGASLGATGSSSGALRSGGTKVGVPNRNNGRNSLSRFRRVDAGEDTQGEEGGVVYAIGERAGSKKRAREEMTEEDTEEIMASTKSIVGNGRDSRRKSVVTSDSGEELAGPITTESKSKKSTRPLRDTTSSAAMEIDSDTPAEAPAPDGPEIIDLTQALASSGSVVVNNEAQAEAVEVVRNDVDVVPMAFDFNKTKALWNTVTARTISSTHTNASKLSHKTLADVVEIDNAGGEEAEEILARVIQKEDFGRMEILGQFNLGFIIVRSKRRHISDKASTQMDGMEVEEERIGHQTEIDDLFIVDQHAADEKYNFETLQLTTKIESQKLLRPRPLDLSASDRLLALENIPILQSNGFEVAVDGDGEESGGEQLVLVSQPVSKSTVFDMSDLSELLHLMQDAPTGSMVRCSKARAMFASRACRKSVMVGHPLTKGQMTSVVRHMGTMDQPWNCPHGRPTMRHLMRMLPPVPPLERKVDWKKIV